MISGLIGSTFRDLFLATSCSVFTGSANTCWSLVGVPKQEELTGDTGADVSLLGREVLVDLGLPVFREFWSCLS